MKTTRPTLRNWRIPLWGLMLLPVLCAPIFLWIAVANRVPPISRWERENRWTMHPLGEFWPKPGEPVVSPDDDLVKVAQVMGLFDGRHFGQSYWVNPDGTIHNKWSIGIDAGGKTVPASPKFLSELPALLKHLPASDPLTRPEDRLYVAFPLQGIWEVRIYQKDSLPREVSDLTNPLFAIGF